MRRAGTAGSHRTERAAHGMRNLVDAVDGGVPLGERLVQRLLIQLGQRKLATRTHGDIGGDAEHRNRRLIGLDQTGQQIGRTAAARAFAHAHLAGHACITVGHVGRAALVAGQDVVHAMIQPRERVIERQTGVAAESENMLHTVVLQHSYHRVCTIHGRSIHLGLLREFR